MFDFEKLDIYSKAKSFNSEVRAFINSSTLDRTTIDQLRRASFSIVLNIAEGSGRFSKADRRNFFVIARSSIFECVAILDVLKDEKILQESRYRNFYESAEEISKMLFAMIKTLFTGTSTVIGEGVDALKIGSTKIPAHAKQTQDAVKAMGNLVNQTTQEAVKKKINE